MSIPPVVIDRLPVGHIPLTWSDHALERAAAKGFDYAPEVIDFADSDVEVVEVECVQPLIPVKVVARLRTDTLTDMVIVITKTVECGWAVKTCRTH